MRADGRGLGRHHDGLADALVIGPSMRDLIDQGYLTDYRVVCPAPSVDMTGVEISETTGDFNQHAARKAVHDSPRLVGDVVREYLRWAPGKLGVTFAIDVESATEIAEAFRRAGVPAEVVHSKTKDDLRRSILRRFANREILQLVNVDLFGEGFDLPAIEVVSMARPTQSFPLYAQQFGRSLRLMISEILQGAWDTYTIEQRLDFIAHSGKPKAMVIDHVANIERHGLPDRPRIYSLDRREKRSKLATSDAIPLRACINPVCALAYERTYKACPYCSTKPEPASRSSIVAVDGDLTELDEATLKAMRGEVGRIDGPAPGHPDPRIAGSMWRTHHERQIAQRDLRHAMGCWGAIYPDDTESMLFRRFYLVYGIDVMSAWALNKADAEILQQRIADRLAVDGFVIREQTTPDPAQLQVA
jgi:superfamily II DNA or RNA helicase